MWHWSSFFWILESLKNVTRKWWKCVVVIGLIWEQWPIIGKLWLTCLPIRSTSNVLNGLNPDVLVMKAENYFIKVLALLIQLSNWHLLSNFENTHELAFVKFLKNLSILSLQYKTHLLLTVTNIIVCIRLCNMYDKINRKILENKG